MARNQSLTSWLTRALAWVPPVDTFVLRREIENGAGGFNALDEIAVDGGQRDSARASAIAEEMERTAQYNADQMPGTQLYTVVARDGTRDRSSFQFRLHGQTSNQLVSPTEPATHGGIAAMALRHNEGIMRIMLQNFDATLSGACRVIGLLSSRLEKQEQGLELRDQNQLKLRMEFERAISEGHQRELSAQVALKQEERKDRAIGALFMLAQNVAMSNQELTAIKTELVAFAQSLSIADLENMRTTLGAEKTQRVVQLLQILMREMEEKQAEANASAAKRAASSSGGANGGA